MTLAAAQVIDAIAARLAPHVATGGRVYTSRSWPIATLPAWRIVADQEAVESAAVDPFNVHTLDISASAYTRAVADVDDAMHTLAADGMALIFAGTVPYGIALTGITRRMEGEGEASVGIITLQLRCVYWVAASAPETIIS